MSTSTLAWHQRRRPRDRTAAGTEPVLGSTVKRDMLLFFLYNAPALKLNDKFIRTPLILAAARGKDVMSAHESRGNLEKSDGLT